ncbi:MULTISPECIES: hypothetical protein [Pseudoalteromonas]|uniref:Uncharacterized protein n=1 Tax=Pseudoalteromonas rubra TaxID=43658 RepID=A0A8T0C0T6_9GAMM|nr:MULTISPECIES: hypothetical protein [Pseudoalteromonas]KAF7781565.1 hypothetical protein PRUB_b0831 [Pseudoalteromonas rubra]MCG7561205.1 hypothetical protein [Pseudoalteromonas sp. McH1-42]MEC4090810.1 hypothetical protein [Pseudoalteromonas rubra]
MKIKVKKTNLKRLSESHSLPQQATPQIAGGDVAASLSGKICDMFSLYHYCR